MHKIIRFFLRNVPKLREYIVLRSAFDAMAKERDFYKAASEMKPQKQSKPTILVAGFDDVDTEPVEPDFRREYVTSVTNAFDFFLRDKLKTQIALIREMLSNIVVAKGLPENMQRNEYDWYLRGMEAQAWYLHDWCIALDGERKAHLQDKENQSNGSI